MKRIICGLLGIFLIFQLQLTGAAANVPYDWNSLPIGGHGFVTGIVFHPLEKDLMYIRTDVGGCYRWDKDNKSWIQLLDTLDVDHKSFYGINGIAIDPQDTNVVYIAAGANLYDNGDVLKSNDRGKTWKQTNLNKHFNGNGPNRHMGECIGVDPVNSNVVYCGTPKEGLYRSDNAASSWKKVNGVEVNSDGSNYVQNVVFDKKSAKDGICQTIYVGVTKKGVYRSQDGGSAWKLLDGTPLSVNRMEVGPSGALYTASSTGLYKFADEQWSEISAPNQIGKAHHGVAVDPNDENNIVTVGNGDIMHLPILRSTDGGKTWVDRLATSKCTVDVKWVQAYEGGNFSANTCDIKMDPFDSKKVWISDWFATYMTEDITAEPTQKWTSPLKGLEEVVPRGAISQPGGKYQLVTAIADIDGLVYEDVTKYPDRMIRVKRQVANEPWMMGTSGIDYCEEDPNIIVRVGIDWNSNGKAEYTTDNCESWVNITNIPHYVDPNGKVGEAIPFGRAAVSATKNPATGKPVIVAVPAYNPNNNKKLPDGMKTVPIYSMDMGQTWNQCEGFPDGTNIMWDYWVKFQVLASDRVNGSKFYICTANNVYVSEDWGKTWKKTARIEGNFFDTEIKTAPNTEGEVWISMGDSGLFRSTDSGKTFSPISSVSSCKDFGFGKAAPKETNPTAYVIGVIKGAYGMYRSTDKGEFWEKINDDTFKMGFEVMSVTGDARNFGVVYVGTGGRGFFVGKPKGMVLEKPADDTPVAPGTVKITYNGKNLEFVDQPVVENGSVMVPIREFLKYFHATMKWDNNTDSLIATRKELEIQLDSQMASGNAKEMGAVFKLGSSTVDVNGVEKTLTTEPHLINDTMYVPVDAAEVFGAKLKWDEKMQNCSISDNALIMYQ